MVKGLLVIFFLCAFLSAGSASRGVHDIHLSLCELRWNEEASAFEVSIKIFIDDLELALSKEGISDLSIGTPKEAAGANDFIAGYLQRHFRIDLDGAPLQPVFVGKEVSEDFMAVWCYVQFSGQLQQVKKCTLSNDILLDIYDDQRNIMDIKMSKTHKAYTIFQPGRNSWIYTF